MAASFRSTYEWRYAATIFSPWTRGSAQERRVSLVVSGKGSLRVKVGGCRTGHVVLRVAVG
jgi:hypothetical protein